MTVVSVLIIYIVFYVVFGAILGFLCSYIAGTKNRDKVGYFFLGFFLGVIGLIVAAAVPKLDINPGVGATTDTPNSASSTPEESITGKSERSSRVMYEFKHKPKTPSFPFAPVISEERSMLGMEVTSYKYSFGAITNDGMFVVVDKIPVLCIPLIEIERIQKENDDPSRFDLVISAIDSKGEIRIVLDYLNAENPEESINKDLKALEAEITREKEFIMNNAPHMENALMGTSQNKDATKQCPFCAEMIKTEAIKCKHCGSMLEA